MELTIFQYGTSEVTFDRTAQMWSLTAMHQAASAPKHKGPSYWLVSEQARELIAALADRETTGISGSLDGAEARFIETREGRNGGTWAHWQIAAAYAHYLNPRFYLQWNEWAMERVTGQGAAPAPLLAPPHADVAETLRGLGGTARVCELRAAMPDVRPVTLRKRLRTMNRRGQLVRLSYGHYALPA